MGRTAVRSKIINQNGKKLFQSKHGYLNVTLYILGILLFSWFIFYLNTIKPRPSALIYIRLFNFAGLMMLLACIRELFLLEKVIFYEKSMEIIDFLGFRRRKFAYQSLDFWIIQEKENKFTKWKEVLMQFSNGEKVKLKSTDYTNFPQIFKKISSIKKENKAEKERKEKISGVKSSLVFLAVSAFSLYVFFDSRPTEILPENVVEITGNLSEPIVTKRRKSSRVIGYEFYLKEYPELDFSVKKEFWGGDLEDYLENTPNIWIKILKSDYEAKILKNANGSLLDRYIFPYDVEVVGVSGYFSPSDYQKLQAENGGTRYIYLVISLGALAFSVFFSWDFF